MLALKAAMASVAASTNSPGSEPQRTAQPLVTTFTGLTDSAAVARRLLSPLLLGTLTGAAALGVSLVMVLLRHRRAQRRARKDAGGKEGASTKGTDLPAHT